MNNIDNSKESWKEFAKKCISLNAKKIGREEVDFSDMSSVNIFNVIFHEDKVGIKVCVNLDDNTIHYYAGDIEYLIEEFDDVKELVENRIYGAEYFYYSDDFIMNKELYAPRELRDRLTNWGYEILKPIEEHNEANLRFYNCEECYRGRIPQDFDILYMNTYTIKHRTVEFDDYPLVEYDVVVIHGAGKIYTFQLKDGIFWKIDDFFKIN